MFKWRKPKATGAKSGPLEGWFPLRPEVLQQLTPEERARYDAAKEGMKLPSRFVLLTEEEMQECVGGSVATPEQLQRIQQQRRDLGFEQ